MNTPPDPILPRHDARLIPRPPRRPRDSQSPAPIAPPPVRPQFPAGDPDDPPAPPPRRRAPRFGCGLPALAVGAITLSLVLVALFLPPLALHEVIREALTDAGPSPTRDPLAARGLVFEALAPDSPVEASGLALSVPPGETGRGYRVRVAALEPADYLAGDVPETGWNCAPDLPAGHALASRVYSLLQEGAPPARLSLRLVPVEGAALERGLELRVWNATHAAWEFVPGQVPAGDGSGAVLVEMSYLPRCVALFREPPSARIVGVTLAPSETFDPARLPEGARLYPATARPLPDGRLHAVLPAGVEPGGAYRVIPVVQNFEDPAVIDVATVRALLADPALRQQHVRAVAALALHEENTFSGVALDYRGLPGELRPALTAFVRDLAALLHAGDATLTVILPAPVYDAPGRRWLTGAYDWGAIGQAADQVAIALPADPEAWEPGGVVEDLIAWATGQISRSDLLLEVSALSIEDQGEGLFVPVSPGEVLARWSTVRLEPAGQAGAGQPVIAQLAGAGGVTLRSGVDEAIVTAYLALEDAGGNELRRLWLTDAAALQARLALAVRANLGGVLVRDLWRTGTLPGLAEVLAAYRVGAGAALDASDLVVMWTVRAGDTVIEQSATSPGALFRFEAPGHYPAVSVEARLDGAVLGRAELTIAQPEPTPASPDDAAATTPTPEPDTPDS